MEVQSLATDYIRNELRPLKHINSFKITLIKQFSKNTSPYCDKRDILYRSVAFCLWGSLRGLHS